jgi:DNA-binding transcriptional LysR family regulator
LLVVLAEQGGIHRAAATLNMSQPAASKLLRELEEALGADLFVRTPRGMQPTVYGDSLIGHARAVLASLEQAQEDLIALKSGHGGKVAIGAITTPGARLLPVAIAAVKRKHADIDFSVEIDSSKALLDRLEQDKLDVVIGRLSTEHTTVQLDYVPLSDEPVCAVARVGHALVGGDEKNLRDVQDATWVVPAKGSVLRHRFELAFRRENLAPPRHVIESSALLFVTRMLEESDMIAILAADVARYYSKHHMLAILPLSMHCKMEGFGIITRSDRPRSPAADAVISALRTIALQTYMDNESFNK